MTGNPTPSTDESSSDNQQSTVAADDSPAKTFQMGFGDGGDLEQVEEHVGTTLDEHGVDVDHTERETRVEQPKGSLLGDARPETDSAIEADQGRLVIGSANQQTLTGDSSQRCPFEDGDIAAATARAPTETSDPQIEPEARKEESPESGDETALDVFVADESPPPEEAAGTESDAGADADDLDTTEGATPPDTSAEA